MKITELRKNIYKIFDEIAENGTQLEITRRGRKIKIVREEKYDKLERLKSPATKVCPGNSDDIISIDWSSEWKEESI